MLEWVGIPFARDLPDRGSEPRSPTLQADSFSSEPPEKSNEYIYIYMFFIAYLAGHLMVSYKNEYNLTVTSRNHSL